MNDADLWRYVTGGFAAIAATVAGWAWKDTKGDIDRNRAHIVTLYQKLEEHARRDEEHFSEVRETMHAHHAELIREINKQ